MRGAPAVSVHCTGGTAWRVVLCVLPAVAAAALVLWASLHRSWPLGLACLLAAAAAALAGLVAARFLPPATLLAWDGAQWRCQGQAVQVQVAMDFGPWMLLRLHADPVQALSQQEHAVGARSCPRWLAVSRRDAGPAEHAFRAAVYCRAPEPTPSGNPLKPP